MNRHGQRHNRKRVKRHEKSLYMQPLQLSLIHISHAGFTKAFKKEFGFSPSFLKVMLNGIRDIGGRSLKQMCIRDSPVSADCHAAVLPFQTCKRAGQAGADSRYFRNQ